MILAIYPAAPYTVRRATIRKGSEGKSTMSEMPQPNFSLRGKRALVTGGSRGLGLGIALGLARAGADLVLVARDVDALASAAAQVRALGRSCEALSCDLSDSAGVDAFYRSAVERAGPVDLLVNNAGVTLRRAVHEFSLEEWHLIHDTNLTSAFAMCRAFARERLESGRAGKILNVTSLNCSASRPGTGAYTASKTGLEGLTRAMAIDWASHPIHVNAIAPGYCRTDLTEPLHTDAAFDKWVRGRVPLGRWGEPDDLAGAAVFLLSPASDYITGQVLYIDGGWSSAA